MTLRFGRKKCSFLQKLLTWVKTFALGGRFPDHAEGDFVINSVTLQGYVRPEVAKAIIQPSEEVSKSAVPSAVA